MELVRHKKFYSVLNLNLNKDKIVRKLNFISTSFSKQKKSKLSCILRTTLCLEMKMSVSLKQKRNGNITKGLSVISAYARTFLREGDANWDIYK